jgi:Bacterial PH domain
MIPTHEHEFEAQLGLPEKLPEGEVILWQGAPNAWAMGVHAFHLRTLGIYFALMLLYQAHDLLEQDTESLLRPMLMTSFLVVMTLLSLAAWAYMSASVSMYTLTNKRVVMRIGVVFSVTFNLPLHQIVSAHELHRNDLSSDISLTLKPADRIGWIHLWPHTRPWALKWPEPTLRCIQGGQDCAQLLKSAWIKANGLESDTPEPQLSALTPPLTSSCVTRPRADLMGRPSVPRSA